MKEFYSQVKPVIDFSVRGLCVKSYYGHVKGCPNFNKRKDCPPSCPKINDLINLEKPVYIIYNRFNFGEHVKRMKDKHPNWTKRQVECCLYWQGTARKQLRGKIKEFKKLYPDLLIVKTPEASGINCTATMKKIGIDLEWSPKKYTYQIVIAGKALEG